MANEVAGSGQVFVCSACGKRSRDKYGYQKIDSGWDESCMLNAILCDEKTGDPVKIQELNNLLKRIFYNQEDTDRWLATPHPDFGGKTPEELIENGRIDAVSGLINDYFKGSFG